MSLNSGSKILNKLLNILLAGLLFQTAFLGLSFAGPLNDLGLDLLNVNGGARPIGMGLAYTGVCDDSNSLFFNPAGIVRTKGIAFTVKDAETFALGQVYPTGYGFSYGFGLFRYSASDVDISDVTLEVSSSMIIAAVGTRLDFLSSLTGLGFWREMDFGVDAKYILDETLKETGQPDKSAKGWDADAGLIYKPLEWLKLSAAIQNLISEQSGAGILKWDSGEADDIKTSTKVGVGIKLIGDRRSPIYMEGNELIISSDFSLREDDPKTLVALGAEWMYDGTYILRVGSRADAKEGKAVSGVTAGAGLRFGPWGFDIAYSPDYLTGKPAYYFSFLYWPREWMFIKKPEESRPKVREEKAHPEREESPELVKMNVPSSEILTDENNVTISGKVLKPGAKVQVNGNEAYVRGDGGFSVNLPINVGKNLVEIRTEYDGRKTLVTRKVLRKAKVLTPEDVKIEERVAKEIKPAEEKIAKTEVEVKTRETRVASAEEKIKVLEKKPLKEDEKAALEVEKRRVEAQKKAIEADRLKVSMERVRVEAVKKKIEEERAKIKEKKAAVEDLATIGVIDVSPDKVYETEQPITRGELASWLVKARGISVPDIKASPFPDVPADHTFAPQIKAAVDAGFMQPYSDGKFRPNEKIKEEEGLAIFKRFTGR